jgi:hypothetical protein
VVVWYDSKHEFEDFIASLGEAVSVGAGQPKLADVMIGKLSVRLAVSTGSLYGLKLAVEPHFAKERPDPLLIYLSGTERDSTDSPLMELETAGKCWTPQANMNLRRVLREVLRDFMGVVRPNPSSGRFPFVRSGTSPKTKRFMASNYSLLTI